MKQMTAAALILVLLSACPASGGRIYDAFQGKDKSMPVLLSFTLEENRNVRLVYDEDVTLIDMEIDGRKLSYSPSGTVFIIPLGRTINRGETILFSVTAEDTHGNTSRASVHFTGRNTDIPAALINEVSIKGTAASPDRVELLFLEEGSAAGMVVSDGLPEDAQHSVILPDIEVNPYDLIVIYWDREAESLEPVFQNGNFGYFVNGNSDTTLSGTNGAVLLYDESGGEIIDGLLYSTGESTLAGGWGNVRTEKAAEYLMLFGGWEGDAVSSLSVTASRVIARLPGGVDTDTASDFFITDTSCSTFGTLNEYLPYEEE